MARHLLLLGALAAAGCLAPGEREEVRRLRSQVEQATRPLPPPLDPGQAKPGPQPQEPRPPRFLPDRPTPPDPLAESLDLRALIDEALRANPGLREMESRARASTEMVRAAGSLDDPRFKFETEGVPIRRPLAFDRTEDNMFGLSQEFPFPGKLAARTEAALADSAEQVHMLRATRSGLILEIKKAYFEYVTLSHELEVHAQHIQLIEEMERSTEARFRNGTAPQLDVLKAQLELVMLHKDVIELEQRLVVVRGRINSLLNRPTGRPLGKPAELVPSEGQVDLEAMEERALARRPELRAMEERARSSRAMTSLAQKDAWLPDIMVGVDYWLVSRGDDAWGGMLSFNLPWLTGKKAAESRRQQELARADELAVVRGTREVLLEVREAHARVEAARAAFLLLRGELLPKARQNVDVAKTSYENSRTSFLDLLVAERSLRNVEVEYFRALAEHEMALAELERAAGTNLEDQP